MVLSKLLVGAWLPLIDLLSTKEKITTNTSQSRLARIAWPPAIILGLAMVARGEIGLLIIQLAYNQSGIVSEEGFITAIWAILLNTIVGPMAVGFYIKLKTRREEGINLGQWK